MVREGGTQSLPRRRPVGKASQGSSIGPGTKLGRYELLFELGRGGMAVVWVARMVGDLGFSRVVALKTILPELSEEPSLRRAMFEEARLMARLGHVNVVEVLELAEQGPLLYQVMTLVEGDTLANLLTPPAPRQDAVPLPPPIAVRVVSDMLGGLNAAHEVTDDHGVPLELVHRDVSPQNILVGVDGVARLTDFGIAKALGRLADETQMGQIRGKPGYFAPEQLLRKPTDRRADIFAAGVVLWEALAGRRLFVGSAGLPALARPEVGPLPDLRAGLSLVPAPLLEVAEQALARDPERRFRTALLMRDALEEAARRTGTVAAALDVGALVRERIGPRLDAQRERIRAVARRNSLPPPLPGAPPPLPAAAPSGARREGSDPPDLASALRQGGVGLPHERTPRSLSAEVEPTAPLPAMKPLTARATLGRRRRGGWALLMLGLPAVLVIVLLFWPKEPVTEALSTEGSLIDEALGPIEDDLPAPPAEPVTATASITEPAAVAAPPKDVQWSARARRAAARRAAVEAAKKKARPMFSNPYKR